MERIIKSDSTFISITGGITMEELISKYKKKVSEITLRYEQVSNFKIRCDCLEYNDGEYYEEQIIISFYRLETEDEYKSRLIQNSRIKENTVNSMKKLIDSNKEETISYLKELGLI